MTATDDGLKAYLGRVKLPVTKEELINGLLVSEAPGFEIALIERLPRTRYESRSVLLLDLEEISHVHGNEVAQATGYDDYLRLVLEHVGDIGHATKVVFNRTAEAVARSAQIQGRLSLEEAEALRDRLDSEFARLRGSMTDVTDGAAPVDPRQDLPRYRD